MIEPIIKAKVLDKLIALEEEHDIEIIYACESGSRAWGFESKNSDYDVRFIYVHNDPDWYLNIERSYLSLDDTIEEMDGDYDLAGWDIAKALWLMRKSNPPLLEWLNSPLVYLSEPKLLELLQTASKEYFTEERSYRHYLHMATGNYKEYLKGDSVRLKKYLYVIRPILACKWLEKYHKDVPVLFSLLVNEFLSGDLLDAVNDLLERKMAGEEIDEGPRIEVINTFLEAEIPRMKSVADSLEENVIPIDNINKVFKKIIGF